MASLGVTVLQESVRVRLCARVCAHVCVCVCLCALTRGYMNYVVYSESVQREHAEWKLDRV